MKKSSSNKKKKVNKFRSEFERTFAQSLESLEIPFEYEPKAIKYVKEHSYTVDFTLGDGKIFWIETKGYFKAEDRGKHLEIKKQRPDLDIRFVFMNDNKIHRNSSMRYSDWCKKHGFKYHIYSKQEEVPREWLKELKIIQE